MDDHVRTDYYARDLPPGLERKEIDGAIQGHIIEEATLMGRYQARGSTRAAG